MRFTVAPTIQKNRQRIYLIGMMGAGKSTIARLIANRLDWIWMDTDACVERNSCMSIAEIFSLYGEDEFRRREWDCVRQTVKFNNIVVACGGGSPCFNNAMELLLDSGIVVYLKAQVDTLMERLSMEEEKRPLLTGIDVSFSERLRVLLEGREAVYQRAHYTVDTDGLSAEEVAEQVMQKIVGSIYQFTNSD